MIARDIRLLYAYRIISRFYFHLPVLLVFFITTAEFTLLEAELLLAIYGLTVTFSMSLAPRLKQRLSNKQVLALGELVKIVGLGALATVPNFWVAILAQAANGFGYSLTASTEAGFISDLAGSAEESGKIQAKSQSYMFLSVLLAGVVGAVIFKESPTGVFIASIVAAFIAAIAVVAIKVSAHEATPKAAAQGDSTAPVATPKQRWWMIYYITVRAVTLAVFVGFLPFFFFNILQITLTYFGVVLGIFSLAAFFSARYAAVLKERLGGGKVVALTLVMSLLSLGVFAFAEELGVALVAIALLGFSSGGVRPLTVGALSETGAPGALIGKMERAFGIVNAGLLVFGGILLQEASYRAAMIAFTVVSVLATLLLLTSRRVSDSTVAEAVPSKG